MSILETPVTNTTQTTHTRSYSPAYHSCVRCSDSHTHTSFLPTANAVSMFSECTQEVMTYLKGTRWPHNSTLRANTQTHTQAHWRTERTTGGARYGTVEEC